MVRPGFGHYNFQGFVSNSIQLLCEHPQKASQPATSLPLKKRRDVRLIRQLLQRNVDEHAAVQSR
jgi:hypothetical protein